MSLIAATQLTAVATVALAVFAIITAVVAYLAFQKQSDELADQRAVNAEQNEVLRLQADELRASPRAPEMASLELRQQWAATLVVWQAATQNAKTAKPTWRLRRSHLLSRWTRKKEVALGRVSAVQGGSAVWLVLTRSGVNRGRCHLVCPAFISYQHAFELVRSHGESGVTARLLPFTWTG